MESILENMDSTEYREMALKERSIGKQICIVEMLCADSDDWPWSFYNVKEMINWMKISEEEFNRIIEIRNDFDVNICYDAANEFAKIKNEESSDTFEYFYSTYGKTYLRFLLLLDENKVESWLKEIVKIYIRNIVWEDKGDYISFWFLKEAMEYYVYFYLEKINDLYEEGFALGVIVKMLKDVLDEEEIRRLMRSRGYTNI